MISHVAIFLYSIKLWVSLPGRATVVVPNCWISSFLTPAAVIIIIELAPKQRQTNNRENHTKAQTIQKKTYTARLKQGMQRHKQFRKKHTTRLHSDAKTQQTHGKPYKTNAPRCNDTNKNRGNHTNNPNSDATIQQ